VGQGSLKLLGSSDAPASVTELNREICKIRLFFLEFGIGLCF
jgi:hypothetical protein